MKQQKLQEKAEKIQEENAMLEKRAREYLKTMRQMLDDIHS